MPPPQHMQHFNGIFPIDIRHVTEHRLATADEVEDEIVNIFFPVDSNSCTH